MLCSSSILVSFASISRWEYILISGLVGVKSSRLSYLLKIEVEEFVRLKSSNIVSMLLKVIESDPTSSFCSVPGIEKLQFQQHRCRCEQ